MATKTDEKQRRSEDRQGSWKGKTPSQRRRQVSKSDDEDTSVGFVTVSVKMRPEEKEELKRVCKALGITPNKALRVMSRKACGFLEIDDETLVEMRNISRQLIGVSRNINQIAKAGNRTLSPDYRAFMEDRAELSKELMPLMRMLQDLNNVATRRTDGKSGLKEAAQAS